MQTTKKMGGIRNEVGSDFMTITGVECRLTTRNRHTKDGQMRRELITPNEYALISIDTGIFRNIDGTPVMITSKVEKFTNIIRGMGYNKIDFDSKNFAHIKCYK